MELTMADHYGDRGTFHDSCNRSLATGQPMAPRIGPEPPPRDEQAIARRLKQLAATCTAGNGRCPICHAGADLNTMKLHWTGMISCADCADATGDARGNH